MKLIQFIKEELFNQSINYKNSSKSSRTKRVQTIIKNGNLYSKIVIGFCSVRGVILFIEPSSFWTTITFSIFIPLMIILGYKLGTICQKKIPILEKKNKLESKELEKNENEIGNISTKISLWATVMIPITIYFENDKFDKGIQFMMTKMTVHLNHIILMQPSRNSRFFEVIYSFAYFFILIIKSFSWIELFFASGAILSTYFVFYIAEKFNLEYLDMIREKDNLIQLNSETFKMINEPVLILDTKLNTSIFSNSAFSSLQQQTGSHSEIELLSKFKDANKNSLNEIIHSNEVNLDSQEFGKENSHLFSIENCNQYSKKLTFAVKKVRKKLKHYCGNEVTALYFHDIGKELDLKILEGNIEFTSLMVYSLSHEVRTPLNGMQGILHLIKNKGEAKYYKQIKFALFCGEFLVSQINCILDYSQIIKGEFKLHLEQVDLHEFFNKIKKACIYIIEGKKSSVDIIVNISENITGKVIIDKERVKQILFNLLTNSIKYTENGHISISANINSMFELEISVSDTGCGFDSEKVESFNQYKSNLLIQFGRNSNKFPGYKLSICQILLTQLKSKLQLVSTKDLGSSFTFSISCKHLKQQIERDVYKRTESGTILEIELTPRNNIFKYQFPTRGLTLNDKNYNNDNNLIQKTLKIDRYIIIVDDIEINRFVIIGMLKKLELVKFIEASNGKEALEIAKDKSRKGDEYLIFMDIDMPLMNGLESTKLIRKFSKNPIIAVTAFIGEEMRSKAKDCGMNDFVTKPVTFANLKAILKVYGYI